MFRYLVNLLVLVSLLPGTAFGVAINGQLKNAQMEKSASNPVANIVESRFYYNTTSKKPLIYNGVSWAELGGSSGGSGEKNYVTNPSAATDTTGWTCVGDLAITRTATAADLPREYTTATGLKIIADADVQSVADYCYYDFTLDDIDQNKKLKIQWAQKQTGTYVASDLAVVITTQADRTTAVATPQTTNIPAVDGVFQTSFDTSSTATLSLVVRATADMATDAGLVISDVIVGPGIQPQGAVRSAALAWTPSNTQGFGTIASVNLFYERDGEDLLIYGKFTAGTVTASEAQISLPSGLTVGSQKGSATALAVGLWTRNIGSASSIKKGTMICQSGVTYVKFSMDDYAAATAPYTASNGSALVSTGEILGIEARIPIAEWAGSGTTNLSQNDVEYSSTAGTWDAASSTTVYGQNGTAMGGALTADRTKTITWQTPYQQGDSVWLEIRDSTAGNYNWIKATDLAPYIVQNTLSYGARVATGTTTQVIFQQYRRATGATYGAVGEAWNTSLSWRVVKAKSGQAVGFSEVAQSSSGLVKSAGQLKGTNTNDSAATGYVGEYMTASATSTTPAATGTFATLTGATLTLTPGDWDVEGVVVYQPTGATFSRVIGAISTSNNALDSSASGAVNAANTTVTDTQFLPTGQRRVTVASGATQVVYLVGSITFSAAGTHTFSSNSIIRARRGR